MTQTGRRRGLPRFEGAFTHLTSQLAALLKAGSWTERGLATKLGISQSHLHNILSGRRKLTSAIADQVLDQMGWGVLDLFPARDLEEELERRKRDVKVRNVPFSASATGGGVVFPGLLEEEVPVPAAQLNSIQRPLVIAMPADELMSPAIAAGDHLLLDRASSARMSIRTCDYYVVQCGNDSMVRLLRQSARGLYLLTECERMRPDRWRHWDCEVEHLEHVVQAKVIARRRPPDGTFRSLAPPSDAS